MTITVGVDNELLSFPHSGNKKTEERGVESRNSTNNVLKILKKWETKCINFWFPLSFLASHGAAAQSMTVKPTGCGFDPHSRRWNIYIHWYFQFFALVSRLSAALSLAIQHAMPPEFGRKWGTECLNTRFPLPTLLCAGYSVKLICKLLYVCYVKPMLLSN